jgi:hypothetical protein
LGRSWNFGRSRWFVVFFLEVSSMPDWLTCHLKDPSWPYYNVYFGSLMHAFTCWPIFKWHYICEINERPLKTMMMTKRPTSLCEKER